MSAHEHYRNARYTETINECHKAFESTLKVICASRGWPVDPHAPAATLLQVVFQHDLVPAFMQSQFGGLRSVLESGVPTVRNKRTAHGAGATPANVPPHLASYVLHLTASAIVFFAAADEALG